MAGTASTAANATPAGGSQFTAPAAQQLAMHVAPLRLDGDGVHRLTVHMHPADLGAVSLVAEIRDGTISLQLSGATEAGRETLRASLTELRRELSDAGFRECHLNLRQDGGQSGQQQSQAFSRRTTSTNAGTAPQESTDERIAVRDVTGRRLDVRA